MKNLYDYIFFGSYLCWKHSFFGIHNDSDEKASLFNSVWAIILLSLFTSLYFLFCSILFGNRMPTNCRTYISIVGFTVPLFVFLFSFLKRKKYAYIIQNLNNGKRNKIISIIVWIIYVAIPIIVLLFIPLS